MSHVFEQGHHQQYRAGPAGQELPVVRLPSRENRRACQGEDFVIIGTNAVCEDGLSQNVSMCGSDPGFIRGKLQFVKAQSREEDSQCRYIKVKKVVRFDCTIKIKEACFRGRLWAWNHRDEPGGCAGGALRDVKRSVESVGVQKTAKRKESG